MGLLRLGARGWCVILALIGLVGFTENWQRTSQDRAFQRHGKTAIAEPVKSVEQTTYSKHGQATGVSYHADVSFKTESGDLVTVPGMTIDPFRLDDIRAGRRLAIDYLPDHPQTARFTGWSPGSSGQTWLGFFMLLGGALGFWFAPKRR
jgi:hypothetical protein